MQVFETDSRNCYIPYMTGTELKGIRLELGYSQQGLSHALDLSLSTVARWEQLEAREIPNSKMLELALTALTIELENSQKTEIPKSKQAKTLTKQRQKKPDSESTLQKESVSK